MTIYYLAQEYGGQNIDGRVAPKEGGFAVAVTNMVTGAYKMGLSGVFIPVFPGTAEFLDYFGIRHTNNSEESCLIDVELPEGLQAKVALNPDLRTIERVGPALRGTDGYKIGDIVTDALLPHLKNGDTLHINGYHFFQPALRAKIEGIDCQVVTNLHALRNCYTYDMDGLPEQKYNLNGHRRLYAVNDGNGFNPWAALMDNSNYLVAVSPRYAQELIDNACEFDVLGRLMQERHADGNMLGILNGIEKHAMPSPKQKSESRTAIIQQYSLNPNSNIISWIHRIDPRQKGVGRFLDACEEILQNTSDVSFVMLGCYSEKDMEASQYADRAKKIQNAHPRNFVLDVNYSEEKKIQLLDASIIHVSSPDYEPCGYSNFEAMLRGAVAVVLPVGGLDDTVRSPNGFCVKNATGFKALSLKSSDLAQTIRQAVSFHEQYPESWRIILENGYNAVPSDDTMFKEYEKKCYTRG